MSEERCENCRFWSVLTTDEDDPWDRRQCRRYPPAIISGQYPAGLAISENGDTDSWTEQLTGVFPITFKDHWCGEWKAKPLPVVTCES